MKQTWTPDLSLLTLKPDWNDVCKLHFWKQLLMIQSISQALKMLCKPPGRTSRTCWYWHKKKNEICMISEEVNRHCTRHVWTELLFETGETFLGMLHHENAAFINDIKGASLAFMKTVESNPCRKGTADGIKSKKIQTFRTAKWCYNAVVKRIVHNTTIPRPMPGSIQTLVDWTIDECRIPKVNVRTTRVDCNRASSPSLLL